MKKIALTGIKPTGIPHLGNYLGAIQPALELTKDFHTTYFIADYHALTMLRDGKELRGLTHKVAAIWLALGLDPEVSVFFQQSRVPEVAELNWILACFTAKGLLNRAHAYKDVVDKNKEHERDLDDGVNAGLFTYPVLMSADILLFGSDVVPVGSDNRQHVEIARDIAISVNHSLGNIFTVPEALIRDEVKIIPGLDGRKMSKSYDNVLPILEPATVVRKAVMKIVTDSLRPEDPKDPEKCNVFAIFKHFAEPTRVEERRRQYAAGGLGYGEMKEELASLLEARFAAPRARYESLLKDPAGLDALLEKGALKARDLAAPRMEKLRKKLGLRA